MDNKSVLAHQAPLSYPHPSPHRTGSLYFLVGNTLRYGSGPLMKAIAVSFPLSKGDIWKDGSREYSSFVVHPRYFNV